MPVAHYENFPVASMLLPPRLRRPVEAIYWFARGADDLADEGEHPAAWRLAALDGYRQHLAAIEAGKPGADPAWQRLGAVIAQYQLPLDLFRDLLDAFTQDVVQSRYADFADVENYCRRSANPVGRLLLHLFGQANEPNLRDSDAICTSLQLLNFCQDVRLDWQKDRIYFPLDEMKALDVTEAHIAQGIVDAPWRRLFMLQLDRALASLHAGRGLPGRLPGRIGLELRAIVAAGERIGMRLHATGGDVFRRRPVLSRADWLVILLRAFQLLPARRAAHSAFSARTP
jgi:squalene synthase HpnC